MNLHEAEKGDDGLILLKEAEENGKPFELIFCDWNMPKFSGIDLLKAKNADPALKKIPFLMVKVENERDYIMKAVALGVDDYILKPFTVKTIEAKLQSVWLRAHVR